jgi:hypothetical protein
VAKLGTRAAKQRGEEDGGSSVRGNDGKSGADGGGEKAGREGRADGERESSGARESRSRVPGDVM